jgi:hypothetical protein
MRRPTRFAILVVTMGLLWPGPAQAFGETKLTAADAALEDFFGFAVAIDGDTLVVGATRDDDGGTDSGSAYVFTRGTGGWSERAKLAAGDADDAFGFSVAVAGDTIVVGAPLVDDPGNPSGISTGGAFVYVRDGDAWPFQAKLTADDGATGDKVGTAVAIGADGNTVVLGAKQDFAADTPGAAYVFVRDGTTWSQQAKLTADDGAAGDNFGFSVAISGDTVVVGAVRDDADAGAAYVFQRDGTTWSQQDKLTAGDAAGFDRLGWSVAVSGDTAVAGAVNAEVETIGSGAAYVFLRSGESWSEQAKLSVGDPAEADELGSGVAISRDERTVLLGGARIPGFEFNIGKVYVFRRSGSTWSEEIKITPGDGAVGDGFGRAVAFSGNVAAVGAFGADDGGSSAGAAYVYDLSTAGDFDADRRADILWRNGETGAALLWQMDGFVKQATGSIGGAGTDWQIRALADFDADSKTDILWRNTASGAALIWLIDGFERRELGGIGAAGPDWEIAGAGDFDADAKSDILWRNTDNGAVAVWLMDGLARVGLGNLGPVPLVWEVQ